MDRRKKLPVKEKLNCSVGKPAGPIAAPGGRALAALELLELELELELGAGEAVEPADICKVWKSTLEALAALWIW